MRTNYMLNKIIDLNERVYSVKLILPQKVRVDSGSLNDGFQGKFDFNRFEMVESGSVQSKVIYDRVNNIDMSQGKTFVVGSEDLYEQIIQAGFDACYLERQERIIPSLINQYQNRAKPSAIMFDYNDRQTSVHSYVREIHLSANLHLFRALPVMIFNWGENDNRLIDPIKVLAINGSHNRKGHTRSLLEQEISRNWTGSYYQSKIINLSRSLSECIGCGGHQSSCMPECIIQDQMTELLPEVLNSDVLIVGTPVYEDTPTAMTKAFMTRLMGATKFNRLSFIGKKGIAIASGYCSGTKSTIKSINNEFEMMGFTVDGRSSREFIELWPDQKTRGGVPNDWYWPD